MRIEEGKYYRTRDGRKVGPAKVSEWPAKGLPWSLGCEMLYSEEGVYGYNFDTSMDIISEWSEGPIVTETIRRIKPGVYGPLKVGAEISVPDCDRPDQPPEREIEAYFTTPYLNASDWRELARVALEIAEYLDAQ